MEQEDGAASTAEIRHRLRLAAHDVRSSLGAIVGYADLIALSNDPDEVREYAEKIARAAAQVETTVNGFDDYVLGPGQAKETGTAADATETVD